MNDQPIWQSAPTVDAREKFHGYRMRLDLADFFQRIAYFLGSFHEYDVLSAVGNALRPGDAFVDGGANIGLVTLHAAGFVGPTGRIDAFECNPRVLERLHWHVRANGLTQVVVHHLALGETEESLQVRLPGFDNAANATLGGIPYRYGNDYVDLGAVHVVRGDDVLNQDDRRPLTIKLDVEGFEVKALVGLLETIKKRRPAIITEVNGETLAHCGNHANQMYQILWPLGYRLFAIDRAAFRGRHRLWLHPLIGDELSLEKDVIWLAEGTEHWQRLQSTMQRRGIYWRHMDIARIAAGGKPGRGRR